jgi:hypothetical protein
MKKVKKHSKKLFLLKETIVKLDSFKLSVLYGGGPTQNLTSPTGQTGIVGPDTLYDTVNGPFTK